MVLGHDINSHLLGCLRKIKMKKPAVGRMRKAGRQVSELTREGGLFSLVKSPFQKEIEAARMDGFSRTDLLGGE